MAKKKAKKKKATTKKAKKSEYDIIEEPKYLSSAQYWEWRTTILEMDLAAKELELQRSACALKEKDTVILKLTAASMRDGVKKYEDLSKNAREEYEKFREKLEKEIGASLKDCAIDPDTLEVKDLKKL